MFKLNSSRTAIKALFVYFNFYLSVKFDSLSCSFTTISFLTNQIYKELHEPCEESLIWHKDNNNTQIAKFNILCYLGRIWKESLKRDGQQFHQYQQNEQSPLNHL